jgi:serine/threonine-protein kinase
MPLAESEASLPTLPPLSPSPGSTPMPEMPSSAADSLNLWAEIGYDSNPAEDNPFPPFVEQVSPLTDVLPGKVGRFEVRSIIAKGGMGMVLRVFDPLLGRELAVKVIRSGKNGDEQQRRFVEEAQISGRLQHPGIVPLHELGRDSAGQPFFAMKLVEGRTLSKLLLGRTSPAEELPRYLHIFEQVCQTVAYAHSKGVLHRDLKPHNIMVGAFGEVQVMDWGLAKQWQKETGAENPPTAPLPAPLEDKASRPEETKEGTVIGTLAYMSPEQARGEVRQLSPRTDVFGLGAILCEILTGVPPFWGKSWLQVLPDVQKGDLTETWRRLETCQAEPELIALARVCLAPRQEDRPADAGEVAQRITTYLSGVQERLRQVELERVQAQTKAAQEHRARILTLSLAGMGLLLLLCGWWLWDQAAGRRQMVNEAGRQALAEARVLRAQKQYAAGVAALRQVDSLLPEMDQTLLPELRRERLELEQAQKDQQLVAALEEVQLNKTTVRNECFYVGTALEGYATAFAAYGLPVETAPVEEVIARLRTSPNKELICAVLDDWAWIKKRRQEPRHEWERLWRIAAAIDPDPWRNRLRHAVQQPTIDQKLLQELAIQAEASHPVITLELMESALWHMAQPGRHLELWRKAYARRPGDFWVNYHLGRVLRDGSPGQPQEALRFHTAALTLRPDSAGCYVNVGHLLAKLGRNAEAENAFRRALELAPHYAMAHNNLGLMRAKQRDFPAAVHHYQEALRLQPNLATAHGNLGMVLAYQGNLAEGMRFARKAMELDPHDQNLALDLGWMLEQSGQRAAAIRVYEKALAAAPHLSKGRLYLGCAYLMQGERAKALVHLHEAERLEPDDPHVLYNLGQALELQDRFTEALPRLEKALAYKPDFALAHFKRGSALMKLNRMQEAIVALERSEKFGRQQGNWTLPSARMIEQCRRWLTLEKRLPAIQTRPVGQQQPANAAECLEFAQLCWWYRKEYVAAVHFYETALAMEPPLAQQDGINNRFYAACAAAQAGCGLGKDAAALTPEQRPAWRQKALRWLRTDLALWKSALDGDNATNQGLARKKLQAWQEEIELACVREPVWLAKLPREEQAQWRSFWEEVAALRRNAATGRKSVPG